jgi:predicted acylesterase/phospholipase RssA
MQRLFIAFLYVLILFVPIYAGPAACIFNTQPEESDASLKTGGTAVVITGAAARIVQESALLESLYKNGWLSNVCFISGTSSGALNTVMLNAILEKKFTWERYHSILFNLTNEDIFIQSGRSLPVNNEPFQQLLTRVVNDSIGYRDIGDLPFQSSISISAVDMIPPFSTTYRLSNIKINNESNPGFDLVEALMASTAIPILFPPVRFDQSFGLPHSSFVDGGVAEDHIPFEAVLQFEKYRGYSVDTLIIVSRKSESRQDMHNEVQNFGNNDSRLFDKLSIWIDQLAMNGFIKSMKEIQHKYPGLAARTYVYIPEFDDSFALLDFADMKKQYTLTTLWAESHKPVPLNQYLAEYAMDVKSQK